MAGDTYRLSWGSECWVRADDPRSIPLDIDPFEYEIQQVSRLPPVTGLHVYSYRFIMETTCVGRPWPVLVALGVHA